MRGHTLARSLSVPLGLWRSAIAVAARAIDTLLRWQELASQRRALLTLDSRMLADIGLSRADAAREAARPFWDDPLLGQVAACEQRAIGVVGALPRRCEC